MKIEIDIPDRLLRYLDRERGWLWNVRCMESDDLNALEPTIAEAILNILDQGRVAMEGEDRTSVIRSAGADKVPF